MLVLLPSTRNHIYMSSLSVQGSESFLRRVLENMELVYLNRNPTAEAILELVRSIDGDQLCYDHLAFRTFGVSSSHRLVVE